MVHKLILAAVGAAFLAALSNAHAEESTQVEKRAAAFASHGMEAAIKTCRFPNLCGGKPFTRQRKEKFNVSDFLNEYRTLTFDGLEVRIVYELEYNGKPVRRPYQNRPQVREVTITTSAWPVPHGLRVGVPRAEVYRVLGKGNQMLPTDCVRYGNIDEQDEVLLCFKKNKLASIAWTPWAD